ncbi:hypothetical protein CTYAZ2_33010 [Comamonas testosteroni]|nr:hypothetical protein CTYAZ2_33010 [Comamonas testosteroni]
MKQEPLQISVIGMVWYLEEDFEEIKRLMADSHTLHRTYAEWLQAATFGEEQQRKSGARVIRAVLRPQEFKLWCQSRGLNIDSKARNAFANHRAMEAIQKGELG